MTRRDKVRSLRLGALVTVLAQGCSSGDGAAGEHPVSQCPGALCGILDEHNLVRASAPSANPALPALVWDETIAGHAQAWADTCPSGHNANRSVGGEALGENMYFGSSATAASPASVVQMWASESQKYDITTNTCNGTPPSGSNLACGHYTQLVWRDTVRVGCGVKVGCAGSWSQVWVCDYAPPGNMISNGVIRAPY
jgi:pathogenesis-related protein 1